MVFYSPVSKKKSKKRGKQNSKSKIFILFLLIIFLSGFGLHLYWKYQIHKLTLQKRELLLTNEHLLKKISLLKNDPKAYEEVARQKYGLIKENEQLIIFEK